MRRTSFGHEFVDSFPDELQEGVLYVSIRYATAAHKCACGCGNTVVTPIRPSAWHLLFDGKTVSLTPSIGNGQFPCRSHYWLEADQVRWTRPMTLAQTTAASRADARAYERYFASRQAADSGSGDRDAGNRAERRPRSRLLAKILTWRRS